MCKLIAMLTGMLGAGCAGCGSKKQDDAPAEPRHDGTVLAGGTPGMSAAEFRYLMDETGITILEAARILGHSRRTICRWRSGESEIDRWKAAAIRANVARMQEWSNARRAKHDRFFAQLDATEKRERA
jgi:DNA-binding transcriptional regulator YiaG